MSKNIGIIGLGLIGSSIALDLKRSGFAKRIIGTDLSKEHQKQALELGIVDSIESLDYNIQNSELVIIATPVDATLKLLPEILNSIPPEITVTDVGSTKSLLIKTVQNHPNRKQYVASHPMSGTENSGPTAALKDLFKDKVAIICNSKESNTHSVNLVAEMYTILNSKIIYMDGESHDEHVGYVSHLSHAISYALAISVLEKEKDDAAIFNLAAGGFASTVRLAKSSVNMWLPIFEQNAKHILPIIDIYLNKLSLFKKYLENGETEKLAEFITEANKIKEKLEKK